MAELVDAHDSKSCGIYPMRVRFSLEAHLKRLAELVDLPAGRQARNDSKSCGIYPMRVRFSLEAQRGFLFRSFFYCNFQILAKLFENFLILCI